LRKLATISPRIADEELHDMWRPDVLAKQGLSCIDVPQLRDGALRESGGYCAA